MLKRYLTETEQQLLLRAARKTNDPLAQRDYWWMRLLIQTGMRIQELSLATLRQAEMALATGWLVMKAEQRKGGKRGHEYCVTQSVNECLRALILINRQHEQACDGEAPLIWGREGARLKVRAYQTRIKIWAHEAGLDSRVSCHWLRHTRGVNIIRRSRASNPLKVAQEALGHASISSTGIYTQLMRAEYEQDLRRIDGARMPRAAARQLSA